MDSHGVETRLISRNVEVPNHLQTTWVSVGVSYFVEQLLLRSFETKPSDRLKICPLSQDTSFYALRSLSVRPLFPRHSVSWSSKSSLGRGATPRTE